MKELSKKIIIRIGSQQVKMELPTNAEIVFDPPRLDESLELAWVKTHTLKYTLLKWFKWLWN